MKSSNKKVMNATAVESSGISFKSKLEKTCYDTLKEKGFEPQYEPRTFILIEPFTPKTPFYDKETDSQRNKRIDNNIGSNSRELVLNKTKVQSIKYTPDFYLRYNDLDVYIECKGFENDCFYLKKKLFRRHLDKVLEEEGQKSMYFEVYTKTQLLQVINIIKEQGNE
jgi:predicted nuclease of restriction endonuclease-like RecB superfamily